MAAPPPTERPPTAQASTEWRLPTELLLPTDRLCRADLFLRATQLVHALATLSGSDLGDPMRLSTPANQAALIVAEAGQAARAEALCRSHLRFLADHHRRTHDPRCLAAALQPWVNTGRLHVLSGRWRDAIEHLALGSRLASGARLDLTDTLTIHAWSDLVAAVPAVPVIAWATEVVDVTKALLRAGAVEVLGEYLTRWMASPGARRVPQLLETRILYGLHRGAYVHTGGLARRSGEHAAPHARLVLTYYALLADVAGGERVDAPARCTVLVERLRALEGPQASRYDRALLARAAAELSCVLGQRDAAVATLRYALDLADTDEPLRAELLLRLRTLAAGADTEALDAALRELAARSGYARVRRRIGAVLGLAAPTPTPSCVDDVVDAANAMFDRAARQAHRR